MKEILVSLTGSDGSAKTGVFRYDELDGELVFSFEGRELRASSGDLASLQRISDELALLGLHPLHPTWYRWLKIGKPTGKDKPATVEEFAEFLKGWATGVIVSGDVPYRFVDAGIASRKAPSPPAVGPFWSPQKFSDERASAWLLKMMHRVIRARSKPGKAPGAP